MNEPAVLCCRGLRRRFVEADLDVDVLKGVDLTLHRADRVAVIGASGTGKSTLLQLLGGLDGATGGEVEVAGTGLSRLSEAARSRLRNRHLGFVYQFHHLLPEFTALENVAMPLMLRGEPFAVASREAGELLERVGLGERTGHKPGELSGGERQRAAVARALVTRPDCVLADEPTGNLDRETAERVFELMLELNRDLGVALLVATHDRDLSRRLGRVVRLEDGVLLPA